MLFFRCAGGVKRSHREKGTGEPVRVPWRVPDSTKLEGEGGFALLQPQVRARPRAVEPANKLFDDARLEVRPGTEDLSLRSGCMAWPCFLIGLSCTDRTFSSALRGVRVELASLAM